ncbi:MAG: glycosyltransferase family 4 protein [Anaerolineae bacterium]
MPDLKVCLATDCYPPSIGGIENHVQCLAQELARAGHCVDVLTHRVPGDRGGSALIIEEDPAGFRVLRLPGMVLSYGGADPMADPRVFGRVHRLLKANRYDIVHGHSFESLLVLATLRAAARLGIPTLLTKHSITVRTGRPGLFNRLAVAAQKNVAARWTRGLVVLSAAGMEEMAGSPVPVHVIHGGVDSNRWRPDAGLRTSVRSQLGYGPNDLVIGYLGRLVASKGVLSLLESAAPLLRTKPDVRLLVVGDGPLRPMITRKVEELALEDRVRLVGAVPWAETPAYLNAMDVFAFPSYTEAFGLALLEALACGLPAVARESAGTREIVREGRNGFLVRGDDELRRRLEDLVEDAELRHRLAGQARAAAETEFGWARAARITASVYRQTMQPDAVSRPAVIGVRKKAELSE